MIEFLNLKQLNARYEREIKSAVQRVVESGRYILGDETAGFEAAFARYCGVRHCIGVANGLEALQLILVAYGIGPGDEVIVPSHTFVATWLAVSHAGARPVPVEPDRFYNLDAERVERAITRHTRAILPVHLYGHPADMDALQAIATRHGLRVIEDAAQAHGARLRGRRVGGLGDAAAFSFYPTKNLGALGDGGAITTNDDVLAVRLRKLRNYGSTQKYQHELLGYNTRLDELQSAILSTKLAHLDEDNRARREVANSYRALLHHPQIALPEVHPEADPVWHLFVVRSRKRDALRAHLERCGVGTLIHYPTPCHCQEAYRTQPWGPLPIAEQLAAEVLSLPMAPELSAEEVDAVASAILAFEG